ncbi:MAG: Ig-like domain-containing protein [candidate division WOR-3 bacterium]
MMWIFGYYFLKSIGGLGGNIYASGKNGYYYIVGQDTTNDTIKVIKVDRSGNIIYSDKFLPDTGKHIRSAKVLGEDTVAMVYDRGIIIYYRDTLVGRYELAPVSGNITITDVEKYLLYYRVWGYDEDSIIIIRYDIGTPSSLGYNYYSIPGTIVKGMSFSGSGRGVSMYGDSVYIFKFSNVIKLNIPSLINRYLVVDTADTFLVAALSHNGGHGLYIFYDSLSVVKNTYLYHSIRTFIPLGISAKGIDTVAVWGILVDSTMYYGFIVLLNLRDTSLRQAKRFSISGTATLYFDIDNRIAIFSQQDSGKVYFMKMNNDFTACNIDTFSTVPALGPIFYVTSSTGFSPDTIYTSPFYYSKSPFSSSTADICPSLYDTTKPRVILTQPDSGEVDVPLSANIGVWFSKPMDTTTIDNANITIRGWDGSSLRNYSFTRTCPLSVFCVLDPYPDFRPNELVYVIFTSYIRDTSANSLIPKTITFRTQTVDTSNPVIVFTTPDSGEVNVPANTNIGVQFSKDMDTTTINGTTISIFGSSSGAHTFDKSCPKLDYCVLNPYTDFATSETVRVEFRSGIMGLNGKNLVPKVITFTTGSVDGNPPTITILPGDTITIYDRAIPVRAYISDNRGIQRVDWYFNSRTYTSFTDCRNEPFNNPDTACFYIPDVPSDTFLLKAYGYDYSGNTSYDSAWVIYLDTTRPYITYTEPNNGAFGVSPTPTITIIFSEDMDTSVWGYLKVLVNTSEYSYTRSWQDRRTLKVNPTVMLPYDSTVKVVVDSFVDLSGNMMVRDSFRFTVVSNATVEVIITKLNPDSVYKNSPDSTYIEAVIRSRYAIKSAEAIVDGNIKYSMIPKDGTFDSPVETVYVRIRFGEFDIGDHGVVVRGYNDYTYGESQVKTVRVLDIKFLSRDNVIIYPNPAKGQAKLRVVFGGDAYATIEIFDLKARKVYSKSQNFKGYTKHEIELPKLPVGVYLLRIRANDEKVEKWFSVIR